MADTTVLNRKGVAWWERDAPAYLGESDSGSLEPKAEGCWEFRASELQVCLSQISYQADSSRTTSSAVSEDIALEDERFRAEGLKTLQGVNGSDQFRVFGFGARCFRHSRSQPKIARQAPFFT